MKKIALIVLLILFLPFSLCAQERTLMLATTTSVNDTGLLDFLAQRLKKERNITLKWVSVGTGKALVIGKRCDADFLLVHAPDAEKKAIQEGYVTERIPFMENFFTIVGPKKIRSQFDKEPSVESILTYIARNNTAATPFVSRGDDSGTHKKELSLWKMVNITPNPTRNAWYLESGQGMLNTLMIANQKDAFVLTDIATWLRFKSKFPDTTLVQYTTNDAPLKNTYSILLLNTAQCKTTQDALAREFTAWLITPAIQQAIAKYTINNQSIFTPLYPKEMPKH